MIPVVRLKCESLQFETLASTGCEMRAVGQPFTLELGDTFQTLPSDELIRAFELLSLLDQLLLKNVVVLCAKFIPSFHIAKLMELAVREKDLFESLLKESGSWRHPEFPWKKHQRHLLRDNHQFAIAIIEQATEEVDSSMNFLFKVFSDRKEKALTELEKLIEL